MSKQRGARIGRRRFAKQILGAAAGAGAASFVSPRPVRAWHRAAELEVGEARVETTPPLGIELAGFHRPQGNERRITGIRQPTAARALVLRHGATQAAVVSLDICAIPAEMAQRVAAEVGRRTGIDPQSVRICATHTHSMPTFRYFRQWGAVSPEYLAQVEVHVVAAVAQAKEDLAPARLYVGSRPTTGANFNRTAPTWKTDREFGPASTDGERWLDTMVHVLRFERAGRRDVLWYHFSAHPVCYTDGDAGPDWPGLVDKLVHEWHGVTPSLLQGHIGDVNPGDGQPWLGVPERVAERVYDGFAAALGGAASVKVDELRAVRQPLELPLDMTRFTDQIARYERDPAACTSGEWVDAGFAADWHAGAKRWEVQRTTLPTTISALCLGDVVLAFHGAELYSYYGLAIRRDSPLPHTLVVGYADDFVGYLTDAAAYAAGEYAAIVVPKILDLPPFQAAAASRLTAAAGEMLRKLVG